MGTLNRDESGQIIVIAALLLAVLFVGLALVLNSAIYTENLATRGDTSTAEAMATGSVTEERLGHAIEAANHQDEEASYAQRTTQIQNDVSSWNRLMGANEARSGRLYSAEVSGVTDGTRVNQSTAGYFEPANSDLLDADPLSLESGTNWQPAKASRIRAFEMTVRRDSLKQADAGLLDTIQDLLDATLDGSSVFWAQFEDGDTHRVYLLDDNNNDSLSTVVTKYEDDTTENVVGICSINAPAPSDNVTVRLTENELEGPNGRTKCPALEVVNEETEDVYYAGVDEVFGTYQFIADRPEGEFRQALVDEYDTLIGSTLDALIGELSDDDVYEESPSDGDPYTTAALYGVSVETTYQDDRITYNRNVTYPATAR